MDLVNNEDFVFTDWRRDTHLVDQGTDIVHRVIRGGIQFMDIVERCSLKARHDSHALQASPSAVGFKQLIVFAKIRAHEVFPTPRGPQTGKHALICYFCIAFSCSGKRLLPYNTTEGRRAIFSCRYNIIIHSLLFIDKTKINKIIHYLRENDVSMSRIKEFYIKYLSWINAYWLVTIVFLIVTFTVGDSSLYKRYTYDEKIRGLEKEIKHYQKEIEINSKKLNDLHTDKEGLERFAREEYFMKRSNEDVFIIKDK